MKVLIVLVLVIFNGVLGVENEDSEHCSSDTDCPEDQICNLETSKCACSPCHVKYLSSNNSCEPIILKKPCGDSDGPECVGSCHGAVNELFPPNAYCARRNGIIKCAPCYKAENRRCVLATPKRSVGLECSEDCECGYGLQCMRHCGCPAGVKWDPKTKKCRKLDYGEECSSDLECNSYGMPNSGFTYRGGICSPETKICTCANDYNVTMAQIVDQSTGFRSVKRICVRSAATTELEVNSVCDIDPIFTSDSTYAAVCEQGMFCYQCPEDEKVGQGRCRTMNESIPVFSKKDQTCIPNTSDNETLEEQLISKLGMVCTNDTNCGYNERCLYSSVYPPCLNGKCACKECHAPDHVGICSPITLLEIGSSCNGSSNEKYQQHSDCIRGIVRCEHGYKFDISGKKCIVDSYNFVGYGALCSPPFLSCSGDFQCVAKNCDCPLSNQHFNRTTKKCDERMPGDTCQFDADCDEHSKRQDFPSGRVCGLKNEKCECDTDFKQIRLPTGAYSPGPCLNITSFKKVDAGTGGRTNIQIFEKCSFFKEYNDTVIEDQVVTELEYSNVSNTSDEGPPKGKVGQVCFVDGDCAENEQCYSDYEPPCGPKRCICRPCFGLGPDGVCAFVVTKHLNDVCQGLDIEAYSDENSKCVNGTVKCLDCFYAYGKECIPLKKGLYGDTCTKACECDSSRGLRCNSFTEKCECESFTLSWSKSENRCVFRDPDRHHSDIRCTKDSDCSFFGSRASTCNENLGLCVCDEKSNIFLESEGTCVPRSFGSNCSNNNECFGAYLEYGLSTFPGAATCKDGKCACSSNYSSLDVKILRRINGKEDRELSNRICVSPKTKQHFSSVSIGDKCSSAPLENANNTIAGLSCYGDGVCVKCNEDNGEGKCRLKRKLLNPNAEVCERFGVALRRARQRNAARYARLGKICSLNGDCGPQEECTWTNVTEFMRPRCGSFGVCVCKFGYKPTTTVIDGITTRYCTDTYNTPEQMEKKHLEYGAPCKFDADCLTYATNNDDGYSYGGGICNNGSCDCAPGYKTAELSLVTGNGVGVKNKTICVHRLANTMAGWQEGCTTKAVLFSDSPKLNICMPPNQDGFISVCYRCPFTVSGDVNSGTNPISFDGYTPLDGKCRLVPK